MPQWHSDLRKRKKTGGRRKAYRSRRRRERGNMPVETTVASRDVRIRKGHGTTFKAAAKSVEAVNVNDPQTGITKRVTILRVLRNPVDKDYDRRGVITKGAIIETELGEARVSSRSGQDGILNAVLVRPREREPR